MLTGASVALLAVVVMVMGSVSSGDGAGTNSRDDQDDQVASRQRTDSTTAPPTTAPVAQLTAEQAFGQAAARLLNAGSFGYHGLSSATDISHVRPGPWVTVELTVVGDVDLRAGRVHEFLVSASAGQVAETVTDGRTVWARLAPGAEDLPAASYEPVRQLTDAPTSPPVASGGALLPIWLAATVDRQATGNDDQGRRTFRATLPAAVLGEIETGRPPVDAEVRLTLDPTGAPAHVEVTTAPQGPPLRLVLDLSKLGEPIPIDLAVDPAPSTTSGR